MSIPSDIVSRLLSLILGAALAISLLLTPSRSFAQSPTTPTYLACILQTTFGVSRCSGQYQIIQGSTPNPTVYQSWLIGNVNTTAAPETEVAYLACTLQTTFGVSMCSGQYQIILGSTPDPTAYQSWFIGYVYPTAVAGTQVNYLACTLQTTFGVSRCSGQYQIIQGSTPNANVYQSWLIGYVTP